VSVFFWKKRFGFFSRVLERAFKRPTVFVWCHGEKSILRPAATRKLGAIPTLLKKRREGCGGPGVGPLLGGGNSEQKKGGDFYPPPKAPGGELEKKSLGWFPKKKTKGAPLSENRRPTTAEKGECPTRKKKKTKTPTNQNGGN